MNNIFTKKFFVWLTIIFFAGNVAWAAEYIARGKEISEANKQIEKTTLNNNILSFSKLFIEKVLKTNKEVDFDTRLQLENSVRSTNDAEILAKWRLFIDSKTEKEAQDNVKELLGILIGKIKS